MKKKKNEKHFFSSLVFLSKKFLDFIRGRAYIALIWVSLELKMKLWGSLIISFKFDNKHFILKSFQKARNLHSKDKFQFHSQKLPIAKIFFKIFCRQQQKSSIYFLASRKAYGCRKRSF